MKKEKNKFIWMTIENNKVYTINIESEDEKNELFDTIQYLKSVLEKSKQINKNKPKFTITPENILAKSKVFYLLFVMNREIYIRWIQKII